MPSPGLPSSNALSASAVTQCAANSGWWLTAGKELMPIMGWMDGIAKETLPISVEPVGRVSHSPRSGKGRPSASEFLR